MAGQNKVIPKTLIEHFLGEIVKMKKKLITK